MKKIVSFLLIAILTIAICSTTVLASGVSNNVEQEIDLNAYEQYKIEFDRENRMNRSASSSIEDAIQYVNSLELEENGFSYIKEACLAELEQYKIDGIELEDYTILVPKTRAKSYFGTYSGKEFYYENTSVANMRRETDGVAKSSSNASKWNDWILGVTDLAMNFADYKWSIPYTMIRSITGVSGTSAVYNGSRNQHVEQFTNTITRSIYRKNGSNYSLCYQDQSSSLRVNLYFCPVGTAFSSDYISIGTTYNGTVKANSASKDTILKQANTYANHGSKVVYTVTTKRVQENW